jgi:hypothetical protein
MEYTITSDSKVCGKIKGEKLTESDILSAGGTIEHLLASGHIAPAGAVKVSPAVKETPAVKEVPQVTPQEEDFPVFNSTNNEQGDKE